jgi:hypothetical protein
MPKAVPILSLVPDSGSPLFPAAGDAARRVVPFPTAIPRTSLRGLRDPVRLLAEFVAGEVDRLEAELRDRRTSTWRKIAIANRLVARADLRMVRS